MSSDRRVWVNLWDASGTGYKGATADFVKLPEEAIVAECRDAVHAKNPNKLASIDVSNLRVYRDAAHFSARETEGPLKASTPLKKPEEPEAKALGVSEETALIVLVPSPSGMCRAFVSNTA